MKPQLPLVIQTLLQRLGLGTFAICVVACTFFGVSLPMNWVAFGCLVTFGCGMLCSMGHLSKPGRFLNSFANPHSHLTKEAIATMVEGVAMLVCVGDGLVYALPVALHWTCLWIAAVGAAVFLIITAFAYQLPARPAWKTKLVSVMFLTSSAAIGSVGTWFLATVFQSATWALFILMVLCCIASALSQVAYFYHLRTVSYGVAVRLEEKPYARDFYLWFACMGVAFVCLAAIAFVPASVVLAILLLACTLVAEFFWRSLFFMAALPVWFFPQYKNDLKPARP